MSAQDYAAKRAEEERVKEAAKKWTAELKAAFMADGWKDADTNRDGEDSVFAIPAFRVARASDGLTIYVGGEYRGKTWEASLICPRDGVKHTSFRDLGAIGYNDSPPTASGSVGRDVQAVKKDILRRVVTPGEPIVAKALAKIQKLVERRFAYDAFIRKVCAAIGKPDPHRMSEHVEGLNRVHIYGDGYGLELNPGGTIDVKTTVNLETFKKLEPMIRDKKKSEAA